LKDWYGITPQQVAAHRGGEATLARFGGSLPTALGVAYPEFEWNRRRFTAHQRRARDNQNLLALLAKAEQKLGIKQVSFASFVIKAENIL